MLSNPRVPVYKARRALLVKNGEIVTASEGYVADIFCADETITRIKPNIPPPPGADVIDPTGKYVFTRAALSTSGHARSPRVTKQRARVKPLDIPNRSAGRTAYLASLSGL
jgi:uncharacterized protein YegP (UPF0339 family)